MKTIQTILILCPIALCIGLIEIPEEKLMLVGVILIAIVAIVSAMIICLAALASREVSRENVEYAMIMRDYQNHKMIER